MPKVGGGARAAGGHSRPAKAARTCFGGAGTTCVGVDQRTYLRTAEGDEVHEGGSGNFSPPVRHRPTNPCSTKRGK